MANWKGIVGTSLSTDEFESYCHGLHWTSWRPSFITLHNTAAPSLAQRPNGLTKQHILNLENSIATSSTGARPASVHR